RDQRADVLSLANEVRRDGSADGASAARVAERERAAETVGRGPGVGQSDFAGGRPPKLVSPERRRRTIEAVRSRLGPNRVSERRICRVLEQSRSTQRYRRRKLDDDRRLIDELRRWCEWYPRFGSERVHQLLLGTGLRVDFKRVHRLWKQEHLQ